MRKILILAAAAAMLAGGWWAAGMPGLALLGGARQADGALPRLRTATVDRGPITAVVAALTIFGLDRFWNWLTDLIYLG